MKMTSLRTAAKLLRLTFSTTLDADPRKNRIIKLLLLVAVKTSEFFRVAGN